MTPTEARRAADYQESLDDASASDRSVTTAADDADRDQVELGGDSDDSSVDAGPDDSAVSIQSLRSSSGRTPVNEDPRNRTPLIRQLSTDPQVGSDEEDDNDVAARTSFAA